MTRSAAPASGESLQRSVTGRSRLHPVGRNGEVAFLTPHVMTPSPAPVHQRRRRRQQVDAGRQRVPFVRRCPSARARFATAETLALPARHQRTLPLSGGDLSRPSTANKPFGVKVTLQRTVRLRVRLACCLDDGSTEVAHLDVAHGGPSPEKPERRISVQAVVTHQHSFGLLDHRQAPEQLTQLSVSQLLPALIGASLT